MQTRRDFLKNAGALLLAGALGNSCSTLEDKDFYEFRKALGAQYDSLPLDKKNQTRITFQDYSQDDKEFVKYFYADSNQGHIPLDDQTNKKVNDLITLQRNGQNLSKLDSFKEVYDLSKDFPWINTNDYSKKDLVFLAGIGEMLAGSVMYSQ